jgi:hypothetical protein
MTGTGYHTKYVFLSRVNKVTKERHIGRTTKDASGNAVEHDVTESWVVVLDNLAKFEFGSEKPVFEVGDLVRHTLEKEHP